MPHDLSFTSGDPKSLKDYLLRRLTTLKVEQTSFTGHWMELSNFISPRRGRFLQSDRNKGDKRYNNIINSVATTAHRTATAGMLAGTMSAARPWFGLETHDNSLMERQEVKEWLFKVEGLLRRILNESNFYAQVPQLLGEMIQFGTGCMTHVDDFNDVARFNTHTIGSYMVSTNDRNEVDTIFREFEWQVGPIVDKFGTKNVNRELKTAYDRGNYDKWFKIIHVIEPNKDRRAGSKLSRDKAFRSIYFEPGNTGENREKLLSIKGFDEFPAYVARWSTTDEDVYGTDCPGMVALGDIKGLQVEEKRKAQAIDKMVNPPLSGPASLRNVNVTSLPGGLNIYDGGDQRQKLEPVYLVDPRLQEMRLDIDAVEQRINSAFFVDLFLAISNIEGIQPRNELDLMQRNEERLLQLGPVLEHLQGELQDRLIDRLFAQAVRANILPPPPEALQGSPLRVKYISSLAMAQRAVATQSIERLALFTGGLVAAGWENALMKFDSEQAVDEYAKATGVPPSLVRSDDVVAAEKAARAEAQAKQVAIEQTDQLASAVEKESAAVKNQTEADSNGGSAS